MVFDEELVIHDFMIVEGKKGHFVGLPSRQIQNNEYREIIQFLSSTLLQELQSVVLRAFEDEKARPEQSNLL